MCGTTLESAGISVVLWAVPVETMGFLYILIVTHAKCLCLPTEAVQ